MVNKRILFLAKYLNPSGVTTLMFNLGKNLIKEGFDVGIACGKSNSKHLYTFNEFKEVGFEIFEVPFPGRDFNLAKGVYSLYKIIKIVRDYRPDLLHVHWRACSLYAELVSRIFDIPYITTLHLQDIPSNFLYKALSFWGDCAIGISEETINDLMHKFNVKQAKLIYNGVDSEYFRPPTENEKKRVKFKFGIPEEKNVISLIGRISRIKGHDILLKAVEILKNNYCIHPYIIFAGIGDERYKEEIIELSKYLKIDDIIFTGFVDSREVLWASDVLVLPSRKEGFPLVVVEAMFCGVIPIRTPAAGAFDQIEDGKDGFIIPFDDFSSLADSLKIIFTDPELKTRMSQNAINKAKRKFSLEKMVKEYIEVYNQVIEKNKKGLN